MSKRLWIALAVVAVVGAGVWKSWTTIRGPLLVGSLEMRPECGGHSYDTAGVGQYFQETLNIPEYNDCQRFINTSRTEYGSLFAIFVSEVAPTLTTFLGPPPQGITPGGGSATVPATPGITNVALIAPASAPAITIAMVDAGDRYDPLGIVGGRNCLYIWYYMSGQQTVWTAKMTIADANSCPQKTAGQLATMPGKVLEVYRDAVEDPETKKPFDRQYFPPVARWDWDLKNSKQYVSIVCDAAWCQIGEPGFVRSDPLPLDNANTTAERAIRLIKGWYDEQYLAKKVGNSIAPSELVAIVFPEAGLAESDDPVDYNGWKTVGWVVVDPKTPDAQLTLDQYKTKLGFRESTFAEPLRMQMKHKASVWRGRVQRKGPLGVWLNKENLTKFRPTGMGGYPVPGTNRWRWRDNDEGTWTRCTQGCCEMSG